MSDDNGRVLDLAAARAARAEARGEAPVLDLGDDGRFTLPIETRMSHVEAFALGNHDGLTALVRDGAKEAGEDPDAVEERWSGLDMPVADLWAIVDWLEKVYPELTPPEQPGKSKRLPSGSAPKSKATSRR